MFLVQLGDCVQFPGWCSSAGLVACQETLICISGLGEAYLELRHYRGESPSPPSTEPGRHAHK